MTRMTPQVRCDEAVPDPRWMLLLGLRIAALADLAATSTLRDASLPWSERAAAAAAIVISGLLVGLVGLLSSTLWLQAGPEGARAAFGPFVRTFVPASIAGAHREHYRWLRFGGWGIRFAWNLHDRPYSVPFVLEGVTILLREGRTVFVSSRQHERLAAAFNGLVGGAGAARAL